MLFILISIFASPDAVFLNHDVMLDCSFPDSGYTETTREVIIPLTARGVERYRELVSSFRNTWESLEITAEIRHWRPGRGASNALLTEEPHGSLLADGRLESSLRDLRVIFPGIEIGDTLLIEIIRHIDRLPMDGFYSYTFYAAARDSISQGSFSVLWPINREIRISSIDFPEPEVTSIDGTTICFSWITASNSAIENLPFALNTAECSPSITVASHQPEDVSAGLFAFFDEVCTEAYLTAADSILTVTGDDPRDICNWVTEEIEYLSGDWGRDPGYSPRFPSETISENAGVCRDKAVLLQWLLRRAGYNPCIILTSSSRGMTDLVGSRSFDHMLVALGRSSGDTLFLDPTNNFSADGYSYTLRGAPYLPLTSSGSELKRFPDLHFSDSLSIRMEGAFNLDSSIIQGEIVITFSGAADELFRSMLAVVAPENRSGLLETLFGMLPGSDIRLEGDLIVTEQPLRIVGTGSWICDYIRKENSIIMLIPGLETFDLVGTRACAYVLPDFRDDIFLETPYAAHLTLNLTGFPSECPVFPDPFESSCYSIKFDIAGDTLKMVEFSSFLQMIPDSSELPDLRKALLARISGFFRTVVFQ